MSREDARQRCRIAGKQLVGNVVVSDVVSTTDAKNAFAMKWRSSGVIPEECRVSDLLHQNERSAYDERCAEWVHDTMSEPSNVTLVSSVEFSGHVGSRFQGACFR